MVTDIELEFLVDWDLFFRLLLSNKLGHRHGFVIDLHFLAQDFSVLHAPPLCIFWPSLPFSRTLHWIIGMSEVVIRLITDLALILHAEFCLETNLLGGFEYPFHLLR